MTIILALYSVNASKIQINSTSKGRWSRSAVLRPKSKQPIQIVVDSNWYTLLETIDQHRQGLRVLAKEKVKEHKQRAAEEQILAPVEEDPHREKRKESLD